MSTDCFLLLNECFHENRPVQDVREPTWRMNPLPQSDDFRSPHKSKGGAHIIAFLAVMGTGNLRALEPLNNAEKSTPLLLSESGVNLFRLFTSSMAWTFAYGYSLLTLLTSSVLVNLLFVKDDSRCFIGGIGKWIRCKWRTNRTSSVEYQIQTSIISEELLT